MAQKKVTQKDIDAAANLTVDHMGGVDQAIESFERAKEFAQTAGNDDAVKVYERSIEAAEKLRPAEAAL